MTLTTLKGDATSPQADGNKIICHICNDLGKWGEGFVIAVSKRWPEPEKMYQAWHQERAQNDFGLGRIQLVQVEKDIHVANMVGQYGTKAGIDGPPIRYDALESCLEQLSIDALKLSASVHMPRIGCGLAGGEWSRIAPLIQATLIEGGSDVYVYDFEPSTV